ncbi:hypothetical protein SARC_03018 [Sphaeroforma arctica JP610]|uniref:phospholipase D n=1 Tax=Sphaeroforma arctica JP610 TaxID=667725 RepID=A0A0L0G7B4_9EUKA|nr:hypothetical protein SARC_03018 [Sphaeroforma arctica JP610]KNC84776.1 hypothetical protein SARC_03018 [Sphaeroforma arctica JP610]|eukprot:XP_014158678.1 hypothetical protein SARC_03018 [Sphaeroforma arctica JP610]
MTFEPWSTYNKQTTDPLLVPDVYYPTRTCSDTRLYNDAHFLEEQFPDMGGDDLWNRMYAEMAAAQKFIYITGWSVYPTLRMIRMPTPGETLQDLLIRKADEGVQVVVMVWGNAVPVFATYDRAVEDAFEGTNVKAIRAFRRIPAQFNLESFGDVSFTHHQKEVLIDNEAGDMIAYVGGVDLTTGRYDDQSHPLVGRPANVDADDYYQNTYADAKAGVTPREPWHDIHSRNTNQGAVDAFNNFVERHEREKKEDTKNADSVLIDYTTLAAFAATATCPANDTWTTQTVRSIDVNSFIPNPEWATPKTMSTMSTGEYNVDMSVHNSYIHHIMAAKKFIYLENQYFLGSAQYWPSSQNMPQNEVPIALSSRITEAVRDGQEFCVYATTPLFPEGLPEAASTQEIMYWQSQTVDMMTRTVATAINAQKAKDSTFNKTISDYLQFFWPGNRQYNDVMSQDNAEMIYVHSKHLLVDDTISIIGSANINDRSMNGDRDTEIAVVAHEPTFVRTASGNTTTLPKGKVYEHRKRLWTEHMGPTVYAACDANPCSAECSQALKDNGQKNMDTFYLPLDQRVDLDNHLIRFPYAIDEDTGAVSAISGKETVPHKAGLMLGKPSTAVPDFGTTRNRPVRVPAGRK